jgi:hypothetical protein
MRLYRFIDDSNDTKHQYTTIEGNTSSENFTIVSNCFQKFRTRAFRTTTTPQILKSKSRETKQRTKARCKLQAASS